MEEFIKVYKEYTIGVSLIFSGIMPSQEEEEFSKALAYYRHRELMRIKSKEILGTAKLEDILYEYSQLPDAFPTCYVAGKYVIGSYWFSKSKAF